LSGSKQNEEMGGMTGEKLVALKSMINPVEKYNNKERAGTADCILRADVKVDGVKKHSCCT
jgi:hypothetical protein